MMFNLKAVMLGGVNRKLLEKSFFLMRTFWGDK